MHWPGASLLVPAGILSGSLVFLPLLFTLKAKEKQSTKDKFVLGVGALSVILVSLSFLFRILHWPHSIELMYFSAALMLLVFPPIYFFSGIRQAETKLNTITTSMLVVMVYSLLFMMVRTPRSALSAKFNSQQELGISYEILLNEQRLTGSPDSLIPPAILHLQQQLNQLCAESKSYVFREDSDTASNQEIVKIDPDKNAIGDPLDWDQTLREKVEKIRELALEYNSEISKAGSKKLSRIRVLHTVLDNRLETTPAKTSVLNQLTQIQLLLLQNTRTLQALNERS